MEIKDIQEGQRVKVVYRSGLNTSNHTFSNIVHGVTGVVFAVESPDYIGKLSVCIKTDDGDYRWGNHKDLELITRPTEIGVVAWIRPKADNNIVNEAVRVLAHMGIFIVKLIKRKG